MWNTAALLGTPLISLANLSIAYALVTPSCARQSAAWLHGVNAASCVACLLLALLCALHRQQAASPEDAGGTLRRRYFMGRVSLGTALLFR
jgi:hypothetical protein